MEHQSAQNQTTQRLGLLPQVWDCPQGQTFSDLTDKATEAASSAFSQLITELEKSGELDQLQSVIRQWSSFDTRFDLYTYIIAITNAIESGNWRQSIPRTNLSDAQRLKFTFCRPPRSKRHALPEQKMMTALHLKTAASRRHFRFPRTTKIFKMLRALRGFCRLESLRTLGFLSRLTCAASGMKVKIPLKLSKRAFLVLSPSIA